MPQQVWLIYAHELDDHICQHVGLIVGSEREAKDYVREHKRKWDRLGLDLEYEEIKVLTS